MAASGLETLVVKLLGIDPAEMRRQFEAMASAVKSACDDIAAIRGRIDALDARIDALHIWVDVVGENTVPDFRQRCAQRLAGLDTAKPAGTGGSAVAAGHPGNGAGGAEGVV